VLALLTDLNLKKAQKKPTVTTHTRRSVSFKDARAAEAFGSEFRLYSTQDHLPLLSYSEPAYISESNEPKTINPADFNRGYCCRGGIAGDQVGLQILKDYDGHSIKLLNEALTSRT
jgi:hypothetical protein